MRTGSGYGSELVPFLFHNPAGLGRWACAEACSFSSCVACSRTTMALCRADSAWYLWGNLEGELFRVWAPMGPGVKLYGKSSEKYRSSENQLSNPNLPKSFSLAGLALVNRGFGVGAALQEGWPGLEKKGFNLKNRRSTQNKTAGWQPRKGETETNVNKNANCYS